MDEAERWGRSTGPYVVATILLVCLGAFVLLLGWPRTHACLDAAASPDCDPATGHTAFVWLGFALLAGALYPLMVLAVAQGIRLGRRDAEAESSV